MARLPACLAALLTPRALDRRVVHVLARLGMAAKRRFVREIAGNIERFSRGRWSGERARRLARLIAYRRVETRWLRLRSLWIADWGDRVQVRGEEHLRRALSQGRGAVLWFSSFCDNAPLFEALAQLGIRAVHLSDRIHGAPSRTRLGWLLGWPIRHMENRHLAKRVVIDGVLGKRQLIELEQALEDGRVVTVRGDLAGVRSIPVELFGGPAGLAPGALYLAWKTGAPLLPVFLCRTGFNHFRVRIEPPVRADRSLGRRAFSAAAAAEFARSFEAWARKHPADWSLWSVGASIGPWGRRPSPWA